MTQAASQSKVTFEHADAPLDPPTEAKARRNQPCRSCSLDTRPVFGNMMCLIFLLLQRCLPPTVGRNVEQLGAVGRIWIMDVVSTAVLSTRSLRPRVTLSHSANRCIEIRGDPRASAC